MYWGTSTTFDSTLKYLQSDFNRFSNYSKGSTMMVGDSPMVGLPLEVSLLVYDWLEGSGAILRFSTDASHAPL